MVHPLRVRELNNRPVRSEGAFVLHWMTAFRRVGWNFALERAIEHAVALRKPLIVFEALRVGYRWACDRFHRFVIDGMIDNAATLAGKSATYYPYLERAAGDGDGLFRELAKQACVVTTDDYPCFFLPALQRAAARAANCLVEAVDANGLLPMRAPDRTFTVAHSFRRWLQKELRPYLDEIPRPDPFKGVDLPRMELPGELVARWPVEDLGQATRGQIDWSTFAISHEVGETELQGGTQAGRKRLAEFVVDGFPRYATERSDPDAEAASGLSPYLHFGHVSSHEVLAAIAKAEGWTRANITGKVTGSVGHWWGASPAFEQFMEELLVWRELGLNMASRERNYDRYESLPEWARNSLEEHASDPREYVYDLATFEQAKTHDPLWNAAQRELVVTGRMHNYMRMLWGKKILEWTASPQEAAAVMIELNNKWALDGRDPNSYSGIFWTLGRYDRAWAPQRPIFGAIRYMSSDSARKKLSLKKWLARWDAS